MSHMGRSQIEVSSDECIQARWAIHSKTINRTKKAETCCQMLFNPSYTMETKLYYGIHWQSGASQNEFANTNRLTGLPTQ